MKTKIIVMTFLLISFFHCNLFSQDTNAVSLSGVFKNAEDYKNGKISYLINCDSSLYKIRLNDFFSKSYIDVIQNRKKIRLSKDSIFGYRDCKHNDYRFYHNYNHEYRILESNDIVIYVVSLPVATSSGKTIQMVPTYFFSRGLSGGLFPLTILNLKKEFPDNLKFHDALDMMFGDGTDILIYDTENKMYKINFLLSQSK